ncbi:MAG: NAD(P)/FAD-dependent oxidoreductase [Melioribacteraceae bacterium]|nr:NAD(P)/FAD-dependent oxidoreductase [Melioribacteraceae bacterium]MCF8264144.1 NAD(P)/FAD-dependent oxidoreductase [Melioribacteraceae bacterium]MCF8430768.1 NAD(P)/FAD-dependent oxidoreductase [Melioribacteraceae bacterium]
MKNKPRVVIIGGGFGGLTVAKKLKKFDGEVLLIDKTNHHLFQPLLYQVATAALSPGDIAHPIRSILNDQKDTGVIMGEVTKIDRSTKTVFLGEEKLKYDYLVISTGSRHSYFGNDNWEKFAPGLKTISDALTIREKILLSFEKAEKITDENEQEKYMTFAVVGGGPTGVEMAGAIAEITKRTMLADFRNINTEKTTIYLIEGTDKLLSVYPEPLNQYTKEALEKLGVKILLGNQVTNIDETGVTVGEKMIKTKNIIWAAGNTAAPILQTLSTKLDRSGRVIVDQDCSIFEDENIFVIGDAAQFTQGINVLPGIAPVAVQQGKFVSALILNGVAKKNRPDFKYFDKGSMATIGRSKAVMQLGDFKFKGFLAWMMWSLVHIAFLINFRKRYQVMTEWIWYYLSDKHGVRLITHKTDL